MKFKPKFEKLEGLVRKAEELGMASELISAESGVVALTYKGRTIYLFGSTVPLNNGVATKLTKYKHITKMVLAKRGINTPKGILAVSWDMVEAALNKKEIKFPLVVKPDDSALGVDVFANIKSLSELKKIVKNCLKRHGKVIVEEYFEGIDHRVLVIDGRIVAACIRSKPTVTGNGKSKVSELINDYNIGRNKPLKQDDEVERNLKKAGVETDTILPIGFNLTLRENSNIATGGMVQDVTGIISEKFRIIALNAVEILGLRMGGVDILTSDIASEVADYVVTEVNGLPSYDIHMLATKGQKIDAREAILMACFRG